MSGLVHMTDEAYIVRRIIDTCLREDVRGIASRGAFAQPSAAIRSHWSGTPPQGWWRIDHLPAGVIWLPAAPCDAMQDVRAEASRWLRDDGTGVVEEGGAACWLAHLSDGLDEETVALHRAYADEAACAIAHRGLARESFERDAAVLSHALDHPTWDERLLACDRLASFRDHPFYPTARAKSGFDGDDLRRYAPEYDPSFALRWLAVPAPCVTMTTPPPAYWPSMADVGLPSSLDATHALLPVHPLTWSRMGEGGEGEGLALPQGSHRAPHAWLTVRPTLSVRTVVPVDHPREHLKLPLLMRTLGALNLRLIKPSTLYDGHWFERVLRRVAEVDDALRDRYVHVDESHGGHVDEARHLSWLVRRYPALDDATLVPVAALCATLPDGRAMAMHLADRWYGGDVLAWWTAYAGLLCDVHLRLWLVHGIALESNQQNAVLIHEAGHPLRLLMKDNDAARVLLPRLRGTLDDLEAYGPLRDARIAVDDDAALARMFCTITLQLCLVAVIEGLAEQRADLRDAMYAVLRDALENTLGVLSAEGLDIAPARRLLDAPHLPVKYLLSAGSLLSKAASGAADINKFYGESGPNFMRDARDDRPAGAFVAQVAG
ncbi:IucA/IucC family protein [Xanthomonas sp. NCPPB 2632]|uniref:IucA/IucC family protein n=1 Tax=Xanthomonas sp. NCPPB 2632 TaxID=3240912 RepID=UPI003518EB30